jgi:hypothetical protein
MSQIQNMPTQSRAKKWAKPRPKMAKSQIFKKVDSEKFLFFQISSSLKNVFKKKEFEKIKNFRKFEKKNVC